MRDDWHRLPSSRQIEEVAEWAFDRGDSRRAELFRIAGHVLALESRAEHLRALLEASGAEIPKCTTCKHHSYAEWAPGCRFENPAEGYGENSCVKYEKGNA